MMRLLCLLTAALASVPAIAQESGWLGPAEGGVRVSVSAVQVQYDEEAREPSQFAVPLSLDARLGNGLALSARASYAVSDGLGGGEINGLGDLQLAASRQGRLGRASVVAGLSANVPTGEGALGADQAETAFLAGQSFYDFPLPTWGQGFNLAPSVTVAAPFGESVAFGAGVAWQYRGAFQPLSDGATEFDPSDELIVTAGADVRVNASTVAAVDVSVVAYGNDVYGDATFEAGRAVGATAEVTSTKGKSVFRLAGRVLSRSGQADLPVATSPESIVPLQARVQAEATLPVLGSASVHVLARSRYYEAASETFGQKTLLDLVVAPEIAVAPGLRIRPHAGVTFGDLTGRQFGLRVTYGL